MPYCAPVTVYVVMPPASLSATMTMMPGPAIARNRRRALEDRRKPKNNRAKPLIPRSRSEGGTREGETISGISAFTRSLHYCHEIARHERVASGGGRSRPPERTGGQCGTSQHAECDTARVQTESVDQAADTYLAQNRARIPRLDKNSLLHLHCAQKIVPDASASVHRQPRGGKPAELLGVERLDEVVALSPALRRFDPQLEVDPRPQERLDFPPGPLPNGLEHPAIPADQHLLVGLAFDVEDRTNVDQGRVLGASPGGSGRALCKLLDLHGNAVGQFVSGQADGLLPDKFADKELLGLVCEHLRGKVLRSFGQ